MRHGSIGITIAMLAFAAGVLAGGTWKATVRGAAAKEPELEFQRIGEMVTITNHQRGKQYIVFARRSPTARDPRGQGGKPATSWPSTVTFRVPAGHNVVAAEVVSARECSRNPTACENCRPDEYCVNPPPPSLQPAPAQAEDAALHLQREVERTFEFLGAVGPPAP